MVDFIIRNPRDGMDEFDEPRVRLSSAPGVVVDYGAARSTGGDPRGDSREWSLSLPHQCQEWLIGSGLRIEVIDDAKKLMADLRRSIEYLEGETG